MDFKNLPLTFLTPLIKNNINTFELINLLIAVEKLFEPKELTRSDFYLTIFDQKYEITLVFLLN